MIYTIHIHADITSHIGQSACVHCHDPSAVQSWINRSKQCIYVHYVYIYIYHIYANVSPFNVFKLFSSKIGAVDHTLSSLFSGSISCMRVMWILTRMAKSYLSSVGVLKAGRLRKCGAFTPSLGIENVARKNCCCWTAISWSNWEQHGVIAGGHPVSQEQEWNRALLWRDAWLL